eukprot:1158603-Pelagomonas_calceolata.AAC.10
MCPHHQEKKKNQWGGSASGASKFISMLNRLCIKLQSKPGGFMSVKTKLYQGLQSVRGVGKVRLHRYIRLQGQLSGNTEACNQTSPKKKLCSEVSTAERNKRSKYHRKCVGSP